MKKIILLLGILAVFSLVVSANVGDPVAYWSFENPNDPGNDYSGYGNDGAVYGAAWENEAISFDGVDDYIEVNDASSLQMNSDMTISLWINPAVLNSTYGTIILWKHDAIVAFLDPSYGLHATPTGEITFNFGHNSHETTSGYGLQTGIWTHIAVTFNNAADELIFYKNGQFNQSISTTKTINNNVAPLYIQAYRYNDGQIYGHFPGKLDEIRIYNRTLSAEEIRELLPNPDSDNDGVLDEDDLCPNTTDEEPNEPNIYGCSCKQILDLKPGKNNGELKHGCSNGTINVFTKLIGWARDLFE